MQAGKGDCFYFIDPFAAAVVVEPDIVNFKSTRGSVLVTLESNDRRGMTIVDPSGRAGAPMATLVEQARLDRLAALYEASVVRAEVHVPLSR